MILGSMNDFYILICGARDWHDYTFIRNVIYELDMNCQEYGDQLHVITGAQRAEGDDDNWVGADWLAIEACMELEIPFHGYPAQWTLARQRYGRNWRRAGSDRNAWQLREHRHHLREAHAFHDDFTSSKGTKDMVKRLENAEVPVFFHAHS